MEVEFKTCRDIWIQPNPQLAGSDRGVCSVLIIPTEPRVYLLRLRSMFMFIVAHFDRGQCLQTSIVINIYCRTPRLRPVITVGGSKF